MHPRTQEEKKHLEVTVAVIWCSATQLYVVWRFMAEMMWFLRTFTAEGEITVATVASYYSTTLQFTSSLQQPKYFTNVSKGRMNG